MRISTFFITLFAALGVAFGAYFVGHSVLQSSNQLDAVAAEPAQAANVAAEANLTAAVSAASSYHFDNGTYVGMTTSKLHGYDTSIGSAVSVKRGTSRGYCIQSTVAGATYSIKGPDGTFVAHGC
jgi:hypothetical protein